MDGDGPRAKAEEGADLTRSAGRGGGGPTIPKPGSLTNSRIMQIYHELLENF